MWNITRSKTGAARILPITPALKIVLKRRRARRVEGDAKVFLHDGLTRRVWDSSWARACRAAGLPGRHLHDCRRTAARNLIRAGVPERIAMVLLGHKTRSMFDRYNIVSDRDLRQAGERLTDYLKTQKSA